MAAAKQNHIGGQAYTAECYENEWGVERDYASAFEWYMKAAEQEDAASQYIIGEYFEEGRGRDIDLIQALFWYRKAVAQGLLQGDAMNAVEQGLLQDAMNAVERLE